jgi:hypothetical protein
LPQEVNGKHPKRVGLSDNVFHRRVAGSSAQPLNAILCSDESSETQDLEELLRRSDEVRPIQAIPSDPLLARQLTLLLPVSPFIAPRTLVYGTCLDPAYAYLPQCAPSTDVSEGAAR